MGKDGREGRTARRADGGRTGGRRKGREAKPKKAGKEKEGSQGQRAVECNFVGTTNLNYVTLGLLVGT